MIILDTNVVSEVMRRDPSPAVMDFLDSHADTTLYLTSITVAEILGGVQGKRDPTQREDLSRRAMLMLRMFSGRELPFDPAASLHFGSIYGPAKLRGITVSFQDCAIASIALHRDCPVATRDATAFEAAGIAVINPFERDR